LPLEIAGSTLVSCLANFATEERADGPDKDNLLEFETPSGPKFVRGSRQRTFATLPRRLILQLNRFAFNERTGRWSKSDTSVLIPELLDVSPYCAEPASGSVRDRRDCLYELTCMVMHRGTAEAGHYWALRRDADRQWRRYDDESVSDTDIGRVLQEGRGTGVKGSPSAYILMYTLAPQQSGAGSGSFFMKDLV
jgi:ubiquitin C-terminal hydrolase